MNKKKLTYFVSDVHLGLDVADPQGRERRFSDFLMSLPEETSAVYLLGDIWDFWYEYRDVVPKGYIRVFSAIQSLVDRGVDVYFFQGNHDVWTYRYFEELGMKKLVQPYVVEIGGRNFCLGHGDGLGPAPLGYRFLRGMFHNRVLQFLFSLLHPWIAFRIGKGWSRNNRLSRRDEYVFKGKDEPLYKFAEEFLKTNRIDHFIFGHYHVSVHMDMPSGASFDILKDWIDGSPYMYSDGIEVIGGSFQNKDQ